MTMKPIDAVKAILPSLSDKEIEELRGILKVNTSPCEAMGHKFTKIGQDWHIRTGFIVVLSCTRCGATVRRAAKDGKPV